VELFEQLRREYEFGVGTIKGVARKFGVHRRLVRQAVISAVPADRTYRQRSKPVLGAVEGFIDGILEADRCAPRKQRHTARRIYHRILAEMPGHTVAESTVRNYVHDRKRTLGLLIRETYVAQSYSWGGEAQWYEAYADLAGDLTKLQVFCMRSMARGGAFHRAYRPASLPGRARARLPALWRRLQTDNLTRHFGGVFRLTISPVRSAKCCAGGCARKPSASSPCARTGTSSSARPVPAMRRAAWRGRTATSGAITGFRFPRRPALKY
jgi:hypothetical protein